MKHYILIITLVFVTYSYAQKDIAPKITPLENSLSIDKTMVLCLSPIDEFRTSFENQMKQQLQFHGVHTETSTKELPVLLKKEEETKKQLLKLMESLPVKGFNKLLISGISDVEKTKIAGDGYFGDFKLYHFTSYLYKVEVDGTTLEWSTCLYIYDYQLSKLSIQDFVNAIISRMITDGILEDTEKQKLTLFTL